MELADSSPQIPHQETPSPARKPPSWGGGEQSPLVPHHRGSHQLSGRAGVLGPRETFPGSSCLCLITTSFLV